MVILSSWLFVLALFCIFAVAAYVLGRRSSPAQQAFTELTMQLKKSEAEFDAYKHKVNAHFLSTAEIVNDMTHKYQAVHEQLASGAAQLCSQEIAVNTLQNRLVQTPAQAHSSEVPVTTELSSFARTPLAEQSISTKSASEERISTCTHSMDDAVSKPLN